MLKSFILSVVNRDILASESSLDRYFQSIQNLQTSEGLFNSVLLISEDATSFPVPVWRFCSHKILIVLFLKVTGPTFIALGWFICPTFHFYMTNFLYPLRFAFQFGRSLQQRASRRGTKAY